MVAMVSHVENRCLKSFINFWPFWWPLCRLGSSSKAYWFACPQKMPFLSISEFWNLLENDKTLVLLRQLILHVLQNLVEIKLDFDSNLSSPLLTPAFSATVFPVLGFSAPTTMSRLQSSETIAKRQPLASMQHGQKKQAYILCILYNLFYWSSTSFVVQF